MPISTARSVRFSSQSIRSSAKVRVFGFPQNSPIRSARSKSGSIQDVEQLGAGGRAQRVEALAWPALELVGSHAQPRAAIVPPVTAAVGVRSTMRLFPAHVC
jgi:hypothetical protein